jgi:dTMP kinase
MTRPVPGGLFVSLEGPDGSGKSTQAARLADALRGRDHAVLLTREPGGTPAGERIRQLLLDPSGDGLGPVTEALLFCAARSELVARVIRPALAAGQIVLCDRFADSTLAYQGYGSGVPRAWLAEVIRGATGGLTPHLTLLFDLPVEVGLARRRTAGDEWNRLDAADLAYHHRVRAGFLDLAAMEPARVAVLAADADPSDVTELALTAVVQRLAALTF